MAEEFLKDVTLPSRGQFYGDKLPGGVVSIEPLGTREEKLFATNRAAQLIDKIFEKCVRCEPLSHTELVLGDRLFLLLQLRVISYGENYQFPFRCSECGAKSYGDVNLDTLPVKTAADRATGLFTVELPLCGSTVEMRLLTGQDEIQIRKYAAQINQKSRGKDVGSEHVYRLARRINKIDGEDVGIRETMEFVESLKGKDSLRIKDAIDDNEVGPELEVEPECHSCGFSNELVLPFEAEFFRPRRRRAGDHDPVRTAEALASSRRDHSEGI